MTAPAAATAIDATPGQRARGFLHRLLMTLGPILARSGALRRPPACRWRRSSCLLWHVVCERGLLSPLGIQQTLTRMAPLLFIAAGLIVAFRAGIWNLGVDGQFLLGAVTAAASAPLLVAVSCRSGWRSSSARSWSPAAVAMIWSLLPAVLRAYQGVNEIITTLMMTFLGTSLANVLVKLVFLDPTTTVPQTRTLPVDDRLPRLFGTTINAGLIVGLVAIIGVQIMMTRTALRPETAHRRRQSRARPSHAGLPVVRN